jgi:CDP-diacylglycerol--glycerol-3-phosphate 3-phosphatidyltransferase
VQRLERKQGMEKERVFKRWDSLTDWARYQARFILEPVVRLMAQVGIHPNAVTITGFLLQMGVGILFGLGRLRLAGFVLLAVAPFDALDGSLARLRDEQSSFGGFLDSTLDRLSDAAIILGLIVHYLWQDARLEVCLLIVALVAAMMVSYTRARAETLGFTCKVGLLTRMERIVLIGLLSALNLPKLMIWALLLLSCFTVAQRILRVYALYQYERLKE